MAIRKRKGFTLVELLVVISIIGMLMALLLPAVQAAREAGRKASCANNLYNISRAVMNYETTKQNFPGYANKINVDKKPYAAGPNGGQYRVGSYMIAIFPYMERKDLFDAWSDKENDSAAELATMIVKLDFGNCPSDSDVTEDGGGLSYVANAGEEYVSNPSGFDGTKHGAAGGLFHNMTHPQARVGMDYVSSKDGTSTTLMLSENVQAGTWNLDATLIKKEDPSLNPPPADTVRDGLVRQAKSMTTFIWWGDVDTEGNPPALGTDSAGQPDKDTARINGGDLYYTVTEAEYKSSDNKVAQKYARPSSSHTGGVTVAFCDGHTRFIREDIDYRLYIQLMTPNGRGIHKDTAAIIKPYIVDENDL